MKALMKKALQAVLGGILKGLRKDDPKIVVNVNVNQPKG